MVAGSSRRAGMRSFVGSCVLLLIAAAAVSSACIDAVKMRLL